MGLNLFWRLLEANLAFLPRRHFGVIQFDDRNWSWQGRDPGQPWFERYTVAAPYGSREHFWCFGDMQVAWTEPSYYRGQGAKSAQAGGFGLLTRD